MNKENGNNLEQPEFDEQDEKIYEAFIGLGYIASESDLEVNDEEDEQCLPLPPELESSSLVLDRIRKRKTAQTQVNVSGSNETESSIPKTDSSSSTNDSDSEIKPYLGYVSDETGFPPSKIEQEVEYSTDFLIQITENSEAVSEAVREEITNKTISRFPQLDRKKISRSLTQKSQKMAAARDSEYSNEEITFEKILESSGMDKKEQEHFLKLNKGEK